MKANSFMGSVVPLLPFTTVRCRQRDRNWDLWDYHFNKHTFFIQELKLFNLYVAMTEIYEFKKVLIGPLKSGYSSSPVAPDYNRKSQLVVKVPIHTLLIMNE